MLFDRKCKVVNILLYRYLFSLYVVLPMSYGDVSSFSTVSCFSSVSLYTKGLKNSEEI